MIDIAHLEQKRVEAICAFAKIRKGIDRLSKLSQDQDSKQVESLIVSVSDELYYLERLFKGMIEFLINQERGRLLATLRNWFRKILKR